MFKFSNLSQERLSTVDKPLQQIAHKALSITRIDFGIPNYGGKRTAEEQHQLYTNGRSKADGYQKRSNHQSGKALDFYAYVDGKTSWTKEDLSQVACAFLQAANQLGYKLEWGGLWKSFLDMPHVQLVTS